MEITDPEIYTTTSQRQNAQGVDMSVLRKLRERPAAIAWLLLMAGSIFSFGLSVAARGGGPHHRSGLQQRERDAVIDSLSIAASHQARGVGTRRTSPQDGEHDD